MTSQSHQALSPGRDGLDDGTEMALPDGDADGGVFALYAPMPDPLRSHRVSGEDAPSPHR